MRREFDALSQGRFDVLVVGGGIYGAWTAYDAALRGLRVAVVERTDWAAGASSASSKLIHGGLRYLEQAQLGLVVSSLRERRRLVSLAPHRVRPIRFIIPNYRGARIGRLRWKIGLWLYDHLSGSRQPVAPHHSLTRASTLELCPFLREDGLRGAVSYGDCQMDDARFGLEIIDGAVGAGATAVNRAEVTRLIRRRSRVQGAEVRDCETDRRIEVRVPVTVDCSGAWGAQLRPDQPSREQARLTKGVHLVLPALPTTHALLLLAPADGRVFFVIPWYGKSLVGTTDTPYDGDPDAVRVEVADVVYLLTAVNAYLRSAWRPEDVLASYAGLRALQHEPDAAPSDVTREWVLQQPEPGLLVSIGGKYSTARADAAIAVDTVLTLSGLQPHGRPTADRPLPWTPVFEFAPWLEGAVSQGMALGLDEQTARTLALRFGSRVEGVHKLIVDQPALGARLDPDLPFCRAEVVQAAEREMARSLDDILRRRIPLTILAHAKPDVLADAAALAGDALGWTVQQQREQVALMLASLNRRSGA